jgi:hypothetical protein
MLCVAFGQHADAAAVGDHGETLARGVADAAMQDEKLGSLVELLSKSSGPWLTVAMAALPLTLQVLANHSVIRPAPQMGIMPKELMEARGRQQADELKRMAEQQMAEMQRQSAQEAPAA